MLTECRVFTFECQGCAHIVFLSQWHLPFMSGNQSLQQLPNNFWILVNIGNLHHEFCFCFFYTSSSLSILKCTESYLGYLYYRILVGGTQLGKVSSWCFTHAFLSPLYKKNISTNNVLLTFYFTA